MAGLNISYLVTPSLQEIYVDPSTGTPLSNGKIQFFKDNARTIPKNVYKLSGSPLGYTYTDLGSEVDLSVAGTPIDESGNDIKIYYYPYDSTGELELYYAKCLDSFSVQKFDRQAWPNLAASVASADNIKNYIDNGQFLVFNTNMFANVVIDASAPPANYFVIYGDESGHGAWAFHKNNSTAKDSLEIKNFPQDIIIEGSPKYYLDINCTQVGSGETEKGLAYSNLDSRIFENNEITISAVMKSTTGSTVSIYFRRYYGTGGSGNYEHLISSQVLTNSFDKYSFTYSVPSTSGETIGIDDSWEIDFVLPFNQLFNFSITNVQINLGNVVFQYIPETFGDEDNKLKNILTHFPSSTRNQNPFVDKLKALTGFFEESSGRFRLDYLDMYPIGSYLQVAHQNDGYMQTRGFYRSDGNVFNKGYFRDFFNVVGLEYVNRCDTTSSAVSSDTLDVTNTFNGATSNATDVNTGFVITTTQAGSPTAKQITRIQAKDASTFPNNACFKFYPEGYGAAFAIVLIKDYLFALPSLPSDCAQWCPVYISHTSTANAITNALLEIFQHLVAQAPDVRGYFFRSTDLGAGRDPNANIRSARPDGVSGDAVGTIQYGSVGEHKHKIGGYGATPADYGIYAYTGIGAKGLATGTGADFYNMETKGDGIGPETRPTNIYVSTYIKVI